MTSTRADRRVQIELAAVRAGGCAAQVRAGRRDRRAERLRQRARDADDPGTRTPPCPCPACTAPSNAAGGASHDQRQRPRPERDRQPRGSRRRAAAARLDLRRSTPRSAASPHRAGRPLRSNSAAHRRCRARIDREPVERVGRKRDDAARAQPVRPPARDRRRARHRIDARIRRSAYALELRIELRPSCFAARPTPARPARPRRRKTPRACSARPTRPGDDRTDGEADEIRRRQIAERDAARRRRHRVRRRRVDRRRRDADRRSRTRPRSRASTAERRRDAEHEPPRPPPTAAIAGTSVATGTRRSSQRARLVADRRGDGGRREQHAAQKRHARRRSTPISTQVQRQDRAEAAIDELQPEDRADEQREVRHAPAASRTTDRGAAASVARVGGAVRSW